MSRSKKPRQGLVRRYTFKLDLKAAQEAVVREHARIVARVWNGCLQRNEDSYRRLSHARHEVAWLPYAEPRKRRNGEIVEGRYVRRHLAHADRLHADPGARKLTSDEKRALFGSEKTVLNLFDLTPEITAARREHPDWQQMSKYSLLRTAKALEEAFGAFFKRAKAGAGDQSGYPRYRATQRADWLPHMFVSGCKLTPSATPGARKNGHVRRWRLRLKGVPGRIRASGELPATPLRWLDADIRQRDGAWWLSVCVEVPNRRDGPQFAPPTPPPKRRPPCPSRVETTVRFDLIDTFAHVAATSHRSGDDDPDGRVPPPPSWGDILALQEQADALKAERDTRYPRKPGQRPSRNWQRLSQRIGSLSARIARTRRERLHEWTTAVVAVSSELTVIAPPVKEHTRSAKGTETDWGAAVDATAAINRHVLSQAPASAVAMLEYKAREAGVPVAVQKDDTPPIAIGGAVARATKAVRKARRSLRKVA